MLFKNLRIHDWRQFANVDIQFDRQLTVLTGPNGSGKTIALSILAGHYMLVSPYTSIPAGPEEFRNDVFVRPNQSFNIWFGPAKEIQPGVHMVEGHAPISEIVYSDNSVRQFTVPFQVERTYQFGFNSAAKVVGVHFGPFDLAPAPVSIERSDLEVQNISKPEDIIRELWKPMYEALNQSDARSFQYELKRSILRWLMLAETDETVLERHKQVQSILTSCLPPSLGFLGVERRGAEILIRTNTAEFSFDASSGGVARVITLVWRIFLVSLSVPEFVVTIDEPENHLHPSMQQSLLIGLVKSFPQAQFVIATHSPFMVTAIKDARVYALVVNGRDVVSKQMHPTSSGALTPDEVFKDVLGMPFTMPIWAENSLQSILEKYPTDNLTQSQITEFVADIESRGLSSLVPSALHVLLKRTKALDQNI